jgi:hypothetical protein
MNLLVPRYEKYEMLRTFDIIYDGELAVTGVRNIEHSVPSVVYSRIWRVRQFGISELDCPPIESRTAQTCFKNFIMSQVWKLPFRHIKRNFANATK